MSGFVPGQKLRQQMAQFAVKGGSPAPAVATIAAAPVEDNEVPDQKAPAKQEPKHARTPSEPVIESAQGLAAADVKGRIAAAKEAWHAKDTAAKDKEAAPVAKGGGKKKGGKEEAPADSGPKSPELLALEEEVKKHGDIVRDLKAKKAAKPEVEAAVKLLLEAKDRVAKYSSSSGGDVAAAPAAAAPAPAVKEAKQKEPEAPAAAGKSSELSVLEDDVKKNADIVRDLKAKKAPKPEVEAAVKLLLAAKDRVAQYRPGATTAAAPAPSTSDAHEVIPERAAVIQSGVRVTLDAKSGASGSGAGASKPSKAEVKSSREASIPDSSASAPQRAPEQPHVRSEFEQLATRIPRVGFSFMVTEAGLRVDDVGANSPADNGGIKKHDVVLSINDKPTLTAEAYFQALDVAPGTPLEFAVRRSGKNVVVKVTPTEPVHVQKETRHEAEEQGGRGGKDGKGKPQADQKEESKSGKNDSKGKQDSKGKHEAKGKAEKHSDKGKAGKAAASLTVDGSSCVFAVVAAFAGFTDSELKIEEGKQTELSGPATGSVTEPLAILRALAELKERKDLLGKTPEEAAVVNEWLSISNKKFATFQSVELVMPRLDRDLLRVVFLVNNRLTLADLALFAAVRPYVSKFDANHKRSFVNVCRWFDFIQNQPQSLDVLPLINLHSPSEVYSSILSEARGEGKHVVASSYKAPTGSHPASSLPDGQSAPYPNGPKPSFGFAFVNSNDGLVVTQVLEGQPAHQSGIAEGDIITAVAGKETKDYKAFFAVFRELSPGQTVEFEIFRQGGRRTVSVTAGVGVSASGASASAPKPTENKKEKVVDIQQQSKKQQSKAKGEMKASAPAEAPKAEAPKAAAAAPAPAAAPASSGLAGEDEIRKQGDVVRDLKTKKAAKPEVEAAVKLLLELKAKYPDAAKAVDAANKKK